MKKYNPRLSFNPEWHAAFKKTEVRLHSGFVDLGKLTDFDNGVCHIWTFSHIAMPFM